jgi:sortase B
MLAVNGNLAAFGGFGGAIGSRWLIGWPGAFLGGATGYGAGAAPRLAAAMAPAMRDTGPPRAVNPKFGDLLERNGDVAGWISVEGTAIDYEVMHDGTHYYLSHDIDHNKSASGSIYMDPSCGPDRDNFNILLHGHHMRNGSMFKDISKYKDRAYFMEHRSIRFDTLYDDMAWEVFSVYVLDAGAETMQTAFMTQKDFVEAANGFAERSMVSPGDGAGFTGDDRLLTLSTCSYEFGNARTVIHARLVEKNGAPAGAAARAADGG